MPIDDHGFFAGGRSSAPATWRSDGRPPGNISRAFHHVIPLRDLSDTWQGLRRGLRLGQRGPFFWAIDKYMSMLGVAGNRQKKIEQMMKDEGFVDQHYVKEDISSKLDWPAWDVVEGPANRADDPGSGFDQFLYGMTPEEKMRQSDIHLLYEAMDAFLRRYRSLEAYTYPLSDPLSKGYTDAERNDPDYRRLVEALVRPMGFIGTKYSRARAPIENSDLCGGPLHPVSGELPPGAQKPPARRATQSISIRDPAVRAVHDTPNQANLFKASGRWPVVARVDTCSVIPRCGAALRRLDDAKSLRSLLSSARNRCPRAVTRAQCLSSRSTCLAIGKDRAPLKDER